jgi:hypothetical protein
MKTKSDNMIASGTCGENLTWTITGTRDNYILMVSSLIRDIYYRCITLHNQYNYKEIKYKEV